MTKVKGYKKQEGNLEVLYALHENGTMAVCVRNYSPKFDEKTNIWFHANSMPVDAEYIGKYTLTNPKAGV